MTDYLDHPGLYEDEGMILDEANRLIARQRAREIVTARDAETWEPPELLTLRQRLALPRPEVEYRIDGWQPANSRVILAAAAKAGKTTALGNLIRALVDGDPWLGVAEVTPAKKIVLLDFEMGAFMLDEWLNDQGIYNEDRITVVPLRGQASTFNIIDPDIRSRWAELLNGTDYLIVDPLKPILTGLGLDERSEADKFLTPFDELLHEAEIPDALISHHMGHHGERSRGDSTLRGWPDVEWFIVKEEDGDPGSPRYIRAFGRDVDQDEALLNYDHDTRHLTLTGGTRSDAKARALVPELVRAVKAEPGMNTTQLAERLDGRKQDIIRASHLAENQGLITVGTGPRNARIHHPILTTGSGTGQRPPVPTGSQTTDDQKLLELVNDLPEQGPPVPTGSHRFRNHSVAPVPGIYTPELVNRSPEEGKTHPFDDRTGGGVDPSDDCPGCGLSDGRHGSVCRFREPTPEEIAGRL